MGGAQSLTCLIVMAVLTGQPPVKNPVPHREVSIASVLKCGIAKHWAVRVRFSPDGSLVAFLLSGGGHWHLMAVSRDGQTVRELAQESGDLPHYFSLPARHYIPWSPDGNYVAVLGSPIRIVRLQDGHVCTIPRVVNGPLVGFVEGPRLVELSGYGPLFLEFRGPDCELQETLPAPPHAVKSASTLPGGAGLVFSTATGVVITDPRGQHQREIDLDFRGISKDLRKDGSLNLSYASFAEDGAVLCAALQPENKAFSKKPYCIELGTGQEAGKHPPALLAGPTDTAERGTRGLWLNNPFTLRDVFTLLPDFVLEGENKSKGWLLWDYRGGTKVLQLGPFRWPGWSDDPVALAPKGDAVAVVKNDLVMFWELPVR